MARYEVIWYDREEKRRGAPFKVNRDTLRDSYFEAITIIKRYSPYLAQNFLDTDIISLVDEDGQHHYPVSFLKEEKLKQKL